MEQEDLRLSHDSFWDISLNTPWKVLNELLMYLIKPLVCLYLTVSGVTYGKNPKFYGFPKILKHKNSTIIIGDNFEARSSMFSNPLGINHPLILCTWKAGAKIMIGNDVGISGGSVIAANEVNIGDRVLIGANSTIIDTDFHPTKGVKRYSRVGVKTQKINIEDDVFIGMNSIILKGVNIKKERTIPAGEVVR